MKVFESLRAWQAARREIHDSVGFVPTMGALHAGHLSLVDRSRQDNTTTVVSIFVNPTQFNNLDDLQKYPRHVNRDIELMQARGVDFLLLPNENEMYEDKYQFQMFEKSESKILCGAFRPGHFEGVLTVVMKLLNLAQADRCYMGEKDYQQLRLIQNMAKAFFMKTEIVGCPTVREPSGLAMSSRNERLTPAGRAHAAKLFEILSGAQDALHARRELERLDFKVDYVEEHWGRRLSAIWYEGVRLIDNVALDPKNEMRPSP